MILLSRLIKSGWTNPEPVTKKVISIRMIPSIDIENDIIEEQPAGKSMEEILADVQLEAEAIKRHAIEEAENIRFQIEQDKLFWEEEKQRLIIAAQNDGFEQGLLQGRDQGLTEYQELIQSAHEVVVASKNEYQKQVESADQTILNIAMSVAEKILNKKLEDQEQFFPIVKRALIEAKNYREIQLHIHPTHYGFLLSHKDELMGLFPRETDFYLYPNDSLTEWSCVIESSNGRIDASVDSQLIEIKKKLQEMMESE
ncbi:flagellar assembly protein FliH [Bacillus sp. CGMCC 1.16607]|uniref:flagellar assembly protein FliH n=1 Tax=Bacillus sp. CGMCC 1.16607 TaxID=3351842 RepID=UPI003630ECB8